MRVVVRILCVATLGVVPAWSPARAGGLRFSLGPHLAWAQTTSGGEDSAMKVAERLGGELTVGWRVDELESGEIRTIPVQVSGLLYVVPAAHLTAGVGWYYVDASFDAVRDRLVHFDDSTWDAGLHLGGGVEIELGSRARLTGDARYVFLGYQLEDVGEVLDVGADFFEIAVGLQLDVFSPRDREHEGESRSAHGEDPGETPPHVR